MSDDFDRKAHAYTTIPSMSPEEFRRLVDGPRLPLRTGYERPTLEQLEASMRRSDEMSASILGIPFTTSFGEPKTVDNGDGTYTHYFDLEPPPVLESWGRHVPDSSPYEGIKVMSDYTTEQPTPSVRRIVRTLGDIVLTLGRIARAKIQGNP